MFYLVTRKNSQILIKLHFQAYTNINTVFIFEGLKELDNTFRFKFTQMKEFKIFRKMNDLLGFNLSCT